jgi:hypothetical protein
VAGEQAPAAEGQHAGGLVAAEQRFGQGEGQQLVGPQPPIRATGGSVDDIEAAAHPGVPEALEARRGPIGQGQPAARIGPREPGEALHGPQGVHPQGIDLHRLAMARGDGPVAGLGIHPGELGLPLPGGQQAIGRIHADPEPGADHMVLEDHLQPGEQLPHQGVAAAGGPVFRQGLEEPQRGIHRVVGALIQGPVGPVREAVGDQPMADMGGEGAQDPLGRIAAPGHQGEPGQADHRVAPPVVEPGVTGDQRGAPGRPLHHEGIGGQHQLADPGGCRRRQHRLGSFPTAQQRLLVVVPFGQRPLAIGAGVPMGADHDGDGGIQRAQAHGEGGRPQVLGAGQQPPFRLHRQGDPFHPERWILQSPVTAVAAEVERRGRRRPHLHPHRP